MARKRVDIVAAAKRPEGRQVIWQAMRELRFFTARDLEGRTRINAGTIRTYLRGLLAAGYLKQADQVCERSHRIPGGFLSQRYQLQRDVGVEAPRVTRNGEPVIQGQAREQMWRTMRIIGDFDWRDLAKQATTEDCIIKDSDARDYIKHLFRAGYLAQLKPAKNGNRPGTGVAARYRLLPSKYTGPLPPMVQRVRQVFDPNLNEVVWPKGGDQ